MTLISRIRGNDITEEYEATDRLQATDIPWTSASGELVKVTVWDVVERALLPADADAFSEQPDATTVDFRRADGLVIVIDAWFQDTVDLACDIIRGAPHEVPIAVFSNFMDVDGATPVVPAGLRRVMGRYCFVPGSLRTMQGLDSVRKWLNVPLLNSKRKMHLGLFKQLEADLAAANAEFGRVAEDFVELESALQHVERVPEVQSRPPPPEDLEDTVELLEMPQAAPRQQVKQTTPVKVVQEQPKRSYEKPYRRRQQMPGAERPKVVAAPNPGAEAPKPAKKPTLTPAEKAPKIDRRTAVEKAVAPTVEELPAVKKSRQKAIDEGAFWSDGEGDDDEDIPAKPNPLVVGTTRHVDLKASIRTTTNTNQQQHKKDTLRQLVTIVVDGDERPAGSPPPKDDRGEYGDLEQTQKTKPAAKRQKIARGRRRTNGGDDD